MLIQADARAIPLRDGCVQCVVTSPPYFGLRDYGIAQQIGLEPTPDAYIAALVAVFQDVRRVLKDDGIVWLNLGDSYASKPKGNPGDGINGTRFGEEEHHYGKQIEGVANKNLIGIPWRVAFALQEDGWYLRSDIIWSKQNCMPESVKDRPTRSHEYLFLLAKQEQYYYDASAIAEPLAPSTLRQAETIYEGKATKDYAGAGAQDPSAVKARIVAKMQSAPARARAKHADTDENAAGRRIVENVAAARAMGAEHDNPFGLTRNKRSVWHLPTQPYSGAHFATMPEALVEPCVLAGSRSGDLVFDPFIGSGTVGAVAERLGRRWVGTDLNPAYHALAKRRTSQRGLRFNEVGG